MISNSKDRPHFSVTMAECLAESFKLTGDYYFLEKAHEILVAVTESSTNYSFFIPYPYSKTYEILNNHGHISELYRENYQTYAETFFKNFNFGNRLKTSVMNPMNSLPNNRGR